MLGIRSGLVWRWHIFISERNGDAKIAQKDSAILVYEEICSL
jgi:hypothetical protein